MKVKVIILMDKLYKKNHSQKKIEKCNSVSNIMEPIIIILITEIKWKLKLVTLRFKITSRYFFLIKKIHICQIFYFFKT